MKGFITNTFKGILPNFFESKDLEFSFTTYSGETDIVKCYLYTPSSLLTQYLTDAQIAQLGAYQKKTYYLVPLSYECDNLIDISEANKMPVYDDSVFTPRPYQKEFLNNFEWCSTNLFNVPTGHGKTFMSIMSSANKNAKSILVFVPSHYLANQWKKAASSNLEVIALKSTGKFVYNKPEKPTMFITTYDLIESAFKIKDKRFYELRRLVTDVDMSIMDECHNLGANTLMKLFFLPIKFKLYLTATFRRHDGREVLMSNFIETKKDMPSKLWKPKTIFVQHFINKVFSKTALINKLSSKGDSEEKINAKIDKLLNYYLEEGCIIYNEPVVFNNRYDNTPLNIEGTYALTKYFKTLVKSEDWPIINSLIGSTYVSQCSQVNYDYEYLDSVVKFLEQVTLNNRKVLVVSNRLNALYYLHSKIDSSLVTGSDKITDEFTEYVASKNVILGSIQLADEGIDIPQIDTLLILTPKKDLAQFYGRGRRTFPNKKYPLCFVPKYNLHTLNMWNIENIFFNEVSLKISEITESFEEATKYLKRVK